MAWRRRWWCLGLLSDGKPEVIATNQTGGPLFFNMRAISTLPLLASLPASAIMAPVDWDADGDVDIIATR